MEINCIAVICIVLVAVAFHVWMGYEFIWRDDYTDDGYDGNPTPTRLTEARHMRALTPMEAAQCVIMGQPVHFNRIGENNWRRLYPREVTLNVIANGAYEFGTENLEMAVPQADLFIATFKDKTQ